MVLPQSARQSQRPLADEQATLPVPVTPAAGTTSIDPLGGGSASTLVASESFAPASPAATIPNHIGRFIIEGRLGAGAFGEVYKAHDPKLRRAVAIKVAQPHRLSSSEDVERFFREARAAAQLKHPNIVAVFELGQDGNAPYIVADFIQGQTLADSLASRPYPAQEAARLIIKLAEAVHYAHQKGIFHRDIKPGNVMIDSQGNAHLMDFGLSRRLEGEELQTQAGDILGTPAYMSPEQARGEAHAVDARSDLYSLGVVFYELLTGRRPFQGKVLELLRQVQQTEPPPLRRLAPGVPRDLEAICLKALAKQADDRYPSVLHFAEDVRRWQSNQPVQARRSSPLLRVVKWTRRRPFTAAAIGVAMAAASTAIVYYQTRPGWLDLRVSPSNADAVVRLGNQTIELDREGRALIAHPPGRFKLTAATPDFVPDEREIVLVRGKENSLVTAIQLTPKYGYVQVTSDPEGASVELTNSQNQTIARGVTPYNSPRLASGTYTASIVKDLYKDVKQLVEAPTGDRVNNMPRVELQPLLENASSFETMRTVRKRLGQRTSFRSSKPFIDAISDLAKQEQLEIFVDSSGLQRAGVNPWAPVSINVNELSLDSVLNRICRPLKEVTYAVEVAADKSWVIHVATHAVAERKMFFTVIYPVKELIAVSGTQRGLDFNSLVDGLTDTVKPESWSDVGGPGRIGVNHGTSSLVIVQSWPNHLLIDDYLLNLREQRLATAPNDNELPEERARQEAVQKLIGLRGIIQTNSFLSGSPVIGIDLTNSSVTELDLELVGLFPKLERLNVGGCATRGDFLKALPEKTNLAQLYAPNTPIDDSSVPQLCRLKRLFVLDLSNTKVTEAALKGICVLPFLTTLYLDGNNISDDGIAAFRSHTYLSELSLSRTKITDGAGIHLAAITRAHSIRLDSTAITDEIFRDLGTNQWRMISAIQTGTTDHGIELLRGASNLETLKLARTQISDAALEKLSSFPKLTALDISSTPVSDHGVGELRRLALRWLDISGTLISDESVEDLAQIESLHSINVRSTGVTAEGVAKLRRSLRRTQVIADF